LAGSVPDRDAGLPDRLASTDHRVTSVPDPAGLPSGVVADVPLGSPALTGADSRRRGRDVRLAAKGGGIVFAGKMFAWGTRFAIAIVLTNLLGAQQYGLYELALTAATIAASFAVLGLDSAVVRWISIYLHRDDRPGLLGVLVVGLGLPGLVSLAIALALLLFADAIANDILNQPAAAPLLPIVAFLVPFMVLNRQLGAALQGLKRIELAVLAEQFSQPPIRFALLMTFLVVAGLGAAEAAAASTLAGGAATAMLSYYLVRAARLRRRLGPVRREVRELMVFSLPIWFSNIVTTVGKNLQVLLLSALDTLRNVGIFAIAVHVNLLASLFHTAVVQSSLAIFAELNDRGDRAGLGHMYQTTSKWTFSLNLPLFIVIVLFPGALLSMFGADFVEGAPALVILGLEALTNSATGTSGSLLDMTGHTRVKVVNSTVAVAASIVLNLLLIPPFGLQGAALAALGATLAVNLLRIGQVWYLLRLLPYDRSFLKPLIAGLLALAAGYAVGVALGSFAPLVQLALGGTAVVATYAVAIIRLGLTADDRMVLERAGRKIRRKGRGRSDEDSGDQESVDDR
jgi:O-antigen/teichoic acid export membrane protein